MSPPSFGWGDEEEEEGYLPQKQETKVNAQGIKTVTEFQFNDLEQKVKIVSKVRVVRREVRRSKAAEDRRQRMCKFGSAVGVADESNVTIHDRNEVKMLSPKAADAEDGTQAANVSSAFAKFQEKRQWRDAMRKHEVNLEEAAEGMPAGGAGGVPADDAPKPGGLFPNAGGPGSGKYVPPSHRAGGGGPSTGRSLQDMSMQDRDYTSLRVTNISTDAKEADLQELFGAFGRVTRVFLAKDRETGESRGFAFVSFSRRDDAERAMEALQGYGYDHLILKIEWAKPSTKEGNAGSEGTQYRSGYGKALAQDTTEKVSYASNLTK